MKQIELLPKNQLPKKYNNDKFLNKNQIHNSEERAMVEAWRTLPLEELRDVATNSGVELSRDKTVVACRLVYNKVPFVHLGKRYIVQG